ncbi:glycosyltransferase family 4 protein [Acinetobacter radioresistens]|uniref:glycosyltransferase n=1 Tax=Acinetobacter radioresistens TaxID=40216 RepID=UPI00157AADCD|nr:glycosyltransferase [Acinetobacter radioresistens]NTY98316.1 glycosyltransferase family 4 protein [Acinetobacter radioresistens]
MKFKKIIHITGMRSLTAGQRQQLKSEYNASLKINSVEWKTIVFHTGEPKGPFEKRIPFFFRPLFLRNLYIWLKVLSYKNQYDLILLRHMTFDPFALIFSYFLKNRISVHHAKEIEELKLIRKGWKGKIVSLIEVITGKISVNNSAAIIGVTQEIAAYENEVRSSEKKLFTYPNGIDVENIELVNDVRENNSLNIVFICGTFSEWHGLDLLIAAINKENRLDKSFKIHLIGKLNNKYIEMLEGSSNFIVHGVMNKDEYIKVIEKCDIALGSLAMFRQNLKEGATLKVREMLALGIPVYSTHIDTSLQDNSIFYLYDEKLNIENLYNFSLNMKKYTRSQVREDVASYIDKASILQKLVNGLNLNL